MKNIPQIQYLAPEEITLSDPCLFWAEEPGPDYIQNIDELGQIEPVLVMAQGSEKILVAGYKRVLALKLLDRKVLALDIPMADSCLKGEIYLLSNQGQVLDQAKIIHALRYFASIDHLSEKVWKQLKLSPGSKIQRLWQSWLTLPGNWDKLLSKNHICLECSQFLEHMAPGDLDLLHAFFADLSWSRGNSINLLTWLTEKVRTDRASLSQVIEKLNLEQILNSGLSPNDKIKSILKSVFQARYPVLSQLKNDLAQRLGSISRESRWRMEHKDEFESREIQISALINSQKDLEKALSQLEQIFRSEAFKDWPVK
jgi:hypothetical protein